MVSVARDMGNGLDSFALLAIPFFILAGDLMGAGGLARRLIDFAGGFPRPFSGRVGAGQHADLHDVRRDLRIGGGGGFLGRRHADSGDEPQGLRRDFNIALTATAATTGLLIPPSNVMIVYAVVASNISIGALFLAGVMPGIVVGLLIMAVCVIVSMVKGYGTPEAIAAAAAGAGRGTDSGRADRGGGTAEKHGGSLPYSFMTVCWRALPSLLLVVFVLGGILSGRFTPTEASAVAVLWAFLLAVVFYREVPMKALPKIAIGSARTTGIVMLLVAASMAMSRLLTEEQVPQVVSEALLGISENPLAILLTINLILLMVGTFMDMTPAVLVFTPIFLPVAVGLGLDPVHFGIMLIANLCIGICTPPVGTCLFLGCSVGKSNIARVSVAMLPFYLAMFIGLMLITYWPESLAVAAEAAERDGVMECRRDW